LKNIYDWEILKGALFAVTGAGLAAFVLRKGWEIYRSGSDGLACVRAEAAVEAA